MPLLTHKQCVEIAYKWCLKNCSVGVAFKELSCAPSNEIADVIAFNSWSSVLIECKVSRSDFLCDKNKSFRKDPAKGMGNKRFYCCPENLINKNELPEGWGLLYINAKGKCRCVYSPYGTVWNGKGFELKNIQAEQGVMYSALRRLMIKGYVKHIYDKDYQKPTANEVIESNSIF